MFFAIELLGKAEAIEWIDHGPAGDHIVQPGIKLRMLGQRQRRIRRVPRPQRTEHNLMAAAGIAERSNTSRSVELSRVRLEPANS